MSLPPLTGVTGGSLALGLGLGAACCWQATMTTIANTSERAPLTTSVCNARPHTTVQNGRKGAHRPARWGASDAGRASTGPSQRTGLEEQRARVRWRSPLCERETRPALDQLAGRQTATT